MPIDVSDRRAQLNLENIQKEGFLKVFIPSGRKEVIQLPWLNSYIIQSLKIKSKSHNIQSTTSDVTHDAS